MGLRRRGLRVAVATGAGALVVGVLSGVANATPGSPGQCDASLNRIACENQLAGSPPSEWEITGSGDDTIQGFATDISVDAGSAVAFKVDTDADAYTIDIYRLGYYGGDGARKVATVEPSARLPQRQPPCLVDETVGLTDCGNWAVSATWTVPEDAVSGVYIARPVRTDNGGASHIPFVVRDDSSRSALLFQTSDTTWQAYNRYGGSSLYDGEEPRARKVSYNRPITTRSDEPWGRNFVFANEYPMIRFLERNGYDVSYSSGIDTDRHGDLLLNHQTFLSVGHDEYWSGRQRANVEAARDAGVNLAFFSGNEVYWRTRYEPSIDGGDTPYRTLVCYKETWDNGKTDPTAEWTGTWRDPRFSEPPNGDYPENALTGTAYVANHLDLPLVVPAGDGRLRIWRGTGVAAQPPGTAVVVAPHIVGYESNEDLQNARRPAGLVRMSTTRGEVDEYLQDYGNVVLPGVTTHSITQYRAPSGALVFSAGTIQWSWGLDEVHDAFTDPAEAVSPDIQQATVNVLADMGAAPTTLMPGLQAGEASTDTTPPTVTIVRPGEGDTLVQAGQITVTGTASDVGGQVGGVEVSADGGATWRRATGRDLWSFSGEVTGAGTDGFLARAVDDSGNIGATASTGPLVVNCPCTLFGGADPATLGAIRLQDGTPLELGVRVVPTSDGQVLGVRYFASDDDVGGRIGSFWSAGGTLLGRATFAAPTGAGWQEVRFAEPVTVSAGAEYIVSYFAPDGRYQARSSGLAEGIEAGPLTAPGSTAGAPNGVFAPGNVFPTSTYQAADYFVDLLFLPEGVVDAAAGT